MARGCFADCGFDSLSFYHFIKGQNFGSEGNLFGQLVDGMLFAKDVSINRLQGSFFTENKLL